MERSTTIVVSDAHLGAAPRPNEEAFLEFLAGVPERGRDLLINGDLFDFWFEYRSVILSHHFQVLRVLAELADAGVRMRMVGGNHDSWGGRFLRDEIGIEPLDGPLTTEVGGRRAFVAHGDGLGGGDWGYRALKKLIRSRPARFAFREVHPDWSARLIRGVSRTESRHGRAADRSSIARAEHLSRLADELLAGDPELDLVIFGHSHTPELREVAPGRHYLNAGDWVHHRTWAEVTREDVKLMRWNPR
jgi:UDP-2,3-diacylglucosamine hydrolase